MAFMNNQKKKFKLLWPILAALALTFWCASVFAAQKQGDALRSVAARWQNGGVSPAGLESRLDIFREDGTKNVPEMTLWAEFTGQRLKTGDDTGITCAVTQIYGHGEDAQSGAILRGGYPARGDTRGCALSDQAAFDLFGGVNAMGQSLEWNGCTYTVQGVFQSGRAVMLVQAASDSEAVMTNMQLRFTDGGSRQQAEEFLARADLGSGLLLLDMPLIAWGLNTVASLPALLIGGWALARLLARVWQRRRYPRLLLTELPMLLPLAAGGVWLCVSDIKLPPSLIPSGWSDFAFWSALPKGWRDSLTQWLRVPAGGDIDLIFAALGIFVLVFLTSLLLTLTLSRVKIQKSAHALIAAAGCIAWMFAMALYYRGLRLSMAMWLLPCLWIFTDLGLYAFGRKEAPPDETARESEPIRTEAETE